MGGLQRMEEERSVAGGRKRTVDEGNRERERVREGGEWKMWKMQEEAEIDCRCVCTCMHACVRVQSGYG